jgi:ABC-type dipeptide/oligopeptide/nickel transport system permease subunit
MAVASTSQKAPGSNADLKQRSLWTDALRRFSQNRVSVLSLFCAIAIILLAILAPIIEPAGYDNQVYSEAWKFPSSEHLMGTDGYGREVFGRIAYGARISLMVALVVQIAALVIGIPLGALAGWYGGKIDYALMRVVDVMSAFPTLLFAILMLSVLGTGTSSVFSSGFLAGGVGNVFIALAATRWISIARLTRGQFLMLREKDYVMASQALGVPTTRIMWRDMMPNAFSPLLVDLSLGIPEAIVGEAGLSFLGIGVNAPIPSWGKMLNESLSTMTTHWYLSVFPALMIALTMYAFTLLGDGIRDALDPSIKT